MGLIENRRGEQTLTQAPNAPIIGWAAFGAASFMALEDKNRRILRALSTSCLMVWAALEFTAGESVFRRAIGAVTLGLLARRR